MLWSRRRRRRRRRRKRGRRECSGSCSWVWLRRRQSADWPTAEMKMLLPPWAREDFLKDAFKSPVCPSMSLSLSLSLLCVDLTLCSASCSLCSQRGRGEVHGVIISPWASGLDQHTRRVFAFGSEEPRDRKANSEEKVPPFDFLEGTVNRIWCGKYGGTTVTQNTDCFSQKVSI